MRRIGLTLGALALMAVGVFAATAVAGGGGHTPTTFCHKPGTPAAQTLTTDDDGFLQGHLGHGDTLGPCSGTPTETTPTETTPTTPAPPRCPPGMEPTGGKDGDESEPHHNQECRYPPTPSSSTTPTPTTPASPAPPAPPSITPPTVTVGPPAPVVTKPPKAPKPDDPPTVVKVSKPNKQGVVKIKTSDGRTHVGVMGSG